VSERIGGIVQLCAVLNVIDIDIDIGLLHGTL